MENYYNLCLCYVSRHKDDKSYTTDERSKNGQKERRRLNIEVLKQQIKSSSEKFRWLHCMLSRCSKLFYTIGRCSFHIESTFSGAPVSFVLSHISRYAPLRFPRYRGTETLAEVNSCIPITHFQCKTHFEHLLTN